MDQPCLGQPTPVPTRRPIDGEVLHHVLSYLPWKKRQLAKSFCGKRAPAHFALVQKVSEDLLKVGEVCGPGRAGASDVAFVSMLPNSRSFNEFDCSNHVEPWCDPECVCFICGEDFSQQELAAEQEGYEGDYPGQRGCCSFIKFDDFPVEDWELDGRDLAYLPKTRGIVTSMSSRLMTSAHYFTCQKCWVVLCWPEKVGACKGADDLFNGLCAGRLGCL